MGRSPCCSKVGLRRGPWSAKEDALLTNYIRQHGEGQWRSLPWKAGLLRCGKSSRLRWMNYLRPGIKRGNISEDEEDLIVRMHDLLGNRWSLIAGRLPGRTDNEIKNYWNTHLLKKLNSAGIHPKPHKGLPKPDGKKKKKRKKIGKAENDNNGSDGGKLTANHPANPQTTDNPPKTKVYLPKPMRVSSVFSRTPSYDSLGSGTPSSDSAEKVPVAEEVSGMPVAWPPLFDELENATHGMYGGGVGEEEEDFLGGGYTLPLLHHSDSISSDVNMLDKVYDEYLQLL